MDYVKLDADKQKAMLEQRLAQYEAEHYNHAVNVALLRASADASSDDVKRAIADEERAMAALDGAHDEVVKRLRELTKK